MSKCYLFYVNIFGNIREQFKHSLLQETRKIIYHFALCLLKPSFNLQSPTEAQSDRKYFTRTINYLPETQS